jgi:hypothetical protein
MDRMIIEEIRDYVFPIQLGEFPLNPASEMFIIEKDSFLDTAFFITTNGVAVTAAHCMPKPETLGEKTTRRENSVRRPMGWLSHQGSSGSCFSAVREF